jgi:hypothetical protein
MNRTVRVWKRDGGLHDVNGADAQKADTQKACFLSKPWHYSGRFDDLAVATEAPWAANKFVKAAPQIARLIFKF